MLLIEEFKNAYYLDCSKLINIEGIYLIGFVYILANYSLQHNEEHRRFMISRLCIKNLDQICFDPSYSRNTNSFIQDKLHFEILTKIEGVV